MYYLSNVVVFVKYERKIIPLYDISIGGVFKCVASINMCTKKAVQLNGRPLKKQLLISVAGFTVQTFVKPKKKN